MFWLNIAYKIIKVFRDGAAPGQIAAGMTLGFMMGFIPGWPLQVFVILLITLILNVNITMVLVSMGLAKIISPLVDSIFVKLGLYMLKDIAQLQGIYIEMYNSPFWMLTRFNHPLVMGGFIAGLILMVPLFFIFRLIVILIQTKMIPKFEKSKIVILIKKSWIYGIYSKIDAVGSKL